MRNDTIIHSTPLLHNINNPAKFQNDRLGSFREIAWQNFENIIKLKSFMRNDTIIDSTPLLHTINNPAKFQNDQSRTFREIARQNFEGRNNK